MHLTNLTPPSLPSSEKIIDALFDYLLIKCVIVFVKRKIHQFLQTMTFF